MEFKLCLRSEELAPADLLEETRVREVNLAKWYDEDSRWPRAID